MTEWNVPEWNERNRQTIEEFRANGRKSSRPLLLLTTTGAKSGKRHTTPLMYLPDGDRMAIFASKGGNPRNPDWYHNLVANKEVTVEVDGQTYTTEAVVAEPDERDRLYARQSELYPNFAEYQSLVKRRIPVVILNRPGR
jgi:deazaflavin-dependent oxidoreductase (nitroreductase family)